MYLNEKIFSLEDVVKALKANNELQFNGIDALECPTKEQCTEMHLASCDGIPSTCNLCQNQKCFQYLVIYRRNRERLGTLKFRFLIRIKNGSGVIASGFIPKDDSQLKQFIGRYITI
jgi:hypothetical protein